MRKWIRRIALWGLIVVSLLAIAWTAVLMTGKQRLDKELAYWRGRGIEIPIDAGFNIKTDETGTARILRVIDLYAEIPESKLELINSTDFPDPVALSEAVASCEEVLNLIHEIAAEDQAFWRGEVLVSDNWMDDLMVRIGQPRSIARLIDAEVSVRIRAGDIEGACESIVAGLSLGRQIGEHPSMIAVHIQANIVEMMVSQFQMIYQDGGASTQEVIDSLWGIDLPARFIPVIEREGVMFTRLGAGHVLSPWSLYDTAYSLAQCQQMVHSIEVMHVPLDELETNLMLEPDPWWAKRFKMIEPGVRGFISRIIHAQGRTEIAKAAILLRQYKSKHGVYPESLTDLEGAGGEPYMVTYIEYEQDGDGYLLTSYMGVAGRRMEWREKE